MCLYDDYCDCDVCNPVSISARDRDWALLVEEEDLFITSTLHDTWLSVDAERASSALVREQQIASFFQAGN